MANALSLGRVLSVMRFGSNPARQLHLASSYRSQTLKEKSEMELPAEEKRWTYKLPLPIFRLWAEMEKRFRPAGKNIAPEAKVLLDNAATQLYFCCANNYSFLTLCNEFGLPDHMSSWFRLTLVHTWMCLVRLQSTLEVNSYTRIRQVLLETLWFDVDQRLKLLSDEFNERLNTKKNIMPLHAVYAQTLSEYDEGFLTDDRELAAALWRNFYMSKSFDPTQLSKAVRYIRAMMAYLDTIDPNDLLVHGMQKWPTFHELMNTRVARTVV
jgi:cytochrome b pre-mRNA-processing protein 3